MLFMSKAKLKFRKWEAAHAISMLPGICLRLHDNTMNILAYKAFCLTSFTYHMYKAVFPEQKVQLALLRADLNAQIVTCFANAAFDVGKNMIMVLGLLSNTLDITQPSGKRLHIVLNGLCILIACYGSSIYAYIGWFAVILSSIAFNITQLDIFHTIMHVLSHFAYFLTV